MHELVANTLRQRQTLHSEGVEREEGAVRDGQLQEVLLVQLRDMQRRQYASPAAIRALA